MLFSLSEYSSSDAENGAEAKVSCLCDNDCIISLCIQYMLFTLSEYSSSDAENGVEVRVSCLCDIDCIISLCLQYMLFSLSEYSRSDAENGAEVRVSCLCDNDCIISFTGTVSKLHTNKVRLHSPSENHAYLNSLFTSVVC